MKFTSLVRFTALLVVLALAVPALAKPVSKEFNLGSPAKIGRAQLEVGQYGVRVDGNKVTVHQGRRLLVETEGQFVERDTKQRYNSVLLGPNGQIEEIRFAGERRVLVLQNN